MLFEAYGKQSFRVALRLMREFESPSSDSLCVYGFNCNYFKTKSVRSGVLGHFQLGVQVEIRNSLKAGRPSVTLLLVH